MSLIVVTIYQASRAMKYMVSVEPTRAGYISQVFGYGVQGAELACGVGCG